MKILHLIERIDDSYGGPAKSVPLLCDGLQSYGIDNVICSVNTTEDHNELIDKFKISWLKAKPSWKSKFYYSMCLFKTLKSILPSVDIVHIHSIWTYPTLLTYFLVRKYKKKIVVSPRSSLFIESLNKSKIKKSIMRFIFVDALLKRADFIVASSQQELDEAALLGDLKLALIPNGIDTDEFSICMDKSTSRQKLKLPLDTKVISFISRIHKRKGLDKLVDAWINLNLDNNDKTCLMIAGPIDDRNYFDEQVDKISAAGLSSNFFYMGMLSGLSRVYAFNAGDLFVLPSSFENFGMCIAESMLAGTPVITSNNTPWDVVNSNESGWCIDLDDLSTTLSEALKSDLATVGFRAKELILKNYSHKNMAGKVASIYKEIIDKS